MEPPSGGHRSAALPAHDTRGRTKLADAFLMDSVESMFGLPPLEQMTLSLNNTNVLKSPIFLWNFPVSDQQ